MKRCRANETEHFPFGKFWFSFLNFFFFFFFFLFLFFFSFFSFMFDFPFFFFKSVSQETLSQKSRRCFLSYRVLKWNAVVPAEKHNTFHLESFVFWMWFSFLFFNFILYLFFDSDTFFVLCFFGLCVTFCVFIDLWVCCCDESTKLDESLIS